MDESNIKLAEQIISDHRDQITLDNPDDILIWASIKGYPIVVRWLLHMNACITNSKSRALRCASIYGHLEIVKHLVSIDMNLMNNNYAIFIAAENGHLDIIMYLVSVGANIHVMDDYILYNAIKSGRLDIVKYVLSIDTYKASVYNECLYYASGYGRLDVLKYMISIGADSVSNDNCAIRRALMGGHMSVVRYLVSIGGYHKSIDLYDYIGLLNWKHLEYDIDHQLRKIIIERENQKRMSTHYYDMTVITTR